VLANAIKRTGLDLKVPGQHIDTLKLARAALAKPKEAGSHTLGTCYKDATGLELKDAHDALADAVAVARVWEWLVTEQGADGRLQVETPAAARFASHLSLVTSQGPPLPPLPLSPLRSGSTGRGKAAAVKKKPAAKDLPPDSLLAIHGLGAGTEAKLGELHGITTVSELREAIAQGLHSKQASPDRVAWVGGEEEGGRQTCIGGCKRWLKESGLRLHPGSRHKIAEWLCGERAAH